MAEIASCSYEARQVTYSAWSAILTNFCNPKIPGFGHRQSWDSGLAKSVGIRDPGIAVPTHYLRSFCGCLPVQSQNILFDISYPTPLWLNIVCTVMCIASDTNQACLLTGLLIFHFCSRLKKWTVSRPRVLTSVVALLWVVLCNTFDISINIVSTAVLMPILKSFRYIVVPQYCQVSWRYQFRYYAVCNWIALLLTTTSAHCMTETESTSH